MNRAPRIRGELTSPESLIRESSKSKSFSGQAVIVAVVSE